MFIAMNRFHIATGSESVFEDLWRKRDSYLDDVPGFRSFNLCKGPSDAQAQAQQPHRADH